MEDGARIIVPATALAQVTRNLARHMRLWRMVQHDETDVVPLNGLHAQAVGALLARTGTSDIADAHVVITRAEARACRHHTVIQNFSSAVKGLVAAQTSISEITV